MGLIKSLYGGISRLGDDQRPGIYQHLNQVGHQLEPYRGRVILVVNTASQCGFANQYDSLEDLYQIYSPRGLVVVGFPSNDFAGQEPGSDAEIEKSCRINHGVTFSLMPKASVRGPSKQPIFTFLTEHGAPDLRGRIWWNFEKFLLDREGHLVGRWRSYVSPQSKSIIRALEKTLAG